MNASPKEQQRQLGLEGCDHVAKAAISGVEEKLTIRRGP
jgi:hypothetical protein